MLGATGVAVVMACGAAVLLAGAALAAAAEAPLECSTETQLRRRGWPDGNGEWCETAAGLRHGPIRVRSRGLRVEGAYLGGAPTGRWRAWWPRGQRAAELHFEDGLVHGALKAWYENGGMLADGAFERGRVTVPILFFDARGRRRYRLDPETTGTMEPHAFDERGREITPEGEWLQTVLPKVYELLLIVPVITGPRAH
jgi:hypothetical protein